MKKGWEIKKLGEVAYIINGKNQSQVISDNGQYPIYGSAANLMGYATDFICEKGTTIIGRKGNISNPILINERFWNVDTAFGIYPKKDFDPKYIHYLCQTIDFKSRNRGTTIPSLVKSDLLNIDVVVNPSLPEQQRIVSILDECFAAIDQAKANAEQNLKNARELFDCVLDSILYDKRWKIEQLGNVCEKVEYGTSSKSKSDGLLPVLRMGNIQNGRCEWDSLVYSDNIEDNKQYLLKHNDVLFNRTNSPELVGKTAIYKSEQPAIFAGYLIRIHRKENLLDADYLNYYLNSRMAFEYGKTVVISSVNQANINGTKLKTYPIPLPTLNEQQTIVRQLDTLRAEAQKLEEVYQQKISSLEELKKSILKKAFAGELPLGTITEQVELAKQRTD